MTRLMVHRKIYEATRQNVNNLINEEKKYYNYKINDCEGDQKKLFSIVDSLLNRKKPTSLPQHDNLSYLVECCSDFLMRKSETIRKDMSELEATTCPQLVHSASTK